MIHLDDVVVLGVGQVPDAPLKPLSRVLADEDGIVRRDRHDVLLRVESLAILSDLVLPVDLAELLGALPLADEDFLSVLVTLFHQLGPVGEQVVQLATSIPKTKIIKVRVGTF